MQQYEDTHIQKRYRPDINDKNIVALSKSSSMSLVV
jgi:hypothetical protein